jgi:hypothetical protein
LFLVLHIQLQLVVVVTVVQQAKQMVQMEAIQPLALWQPQKAAEAVQVLQHLVVPLGLLEVVAAVAVEAHQVPTQAVAVAVAQDNLICLLLQLLNFMESGAEEVFKAAQVDLL